MGPTLTTVFIVLASVVIILWDVVLALHAPTGDTYSEVIRNAGRKWQPLVMLVCFGLGLLAGHWFW